MAVTLVASGMGWPQRLTIDVTVARDVLDPERDGHADARALFELARRGEVELITAPQGYRLDVEGELAEQLQELFEREDVLQARQVARVSEVTYPGEDLIPGHHVEGFAEACELVAKDWPRAPGLADRFHVETHLIEGRDVFLTDDRALRVMCGRLGEEHGFSILAMTPADYLEQRESAAS
jgi:hypothetical protein